MQNFEGAKSPPPPPARKYYEKEFSRNYFSAIISCQRVVRGYQGTRQASIPVYTRIFLVGVRGVLKHSKTRYTPENEIGMNFGNIFPLLLKLSAKLRRMSETPTTTTSQNKYRNTPPICIAVRLQFVLQCFWFWCCWALRKGNIVTAPPICIAVRLPFVLQYATHLYRSTFGKILVVVVTGMFPQNSSSHRYNIP